MSIAIVPEKILNLLISVNSFIFIIENNALKCDVSDAYIIFWHNKNA